MLKIRGLQVVRQQQVILDNIHLDIQPEESIALKGISGCGKSTLLKTLLGGCPWSAEAFLFNDQTITPDTISLVRQQSGYIGQESVLPGATVLDALEAPFQFKAYCHREFPNQRLQQLLCDFYLSDNLLTSPPSKLSGGQKQRFNIIRSLLLEPTLIIADEPTSALDPESKLPAIHHLLKSGNTVVTVHDNFHEAFSHLTSNSSSTAPYISSSHVST